MEIDALSEKQKMLRGELYNATDRELVLERQDAQSQLALLNRSSNPEERVAMLRSLLGSIGDETVVRSPFFCDYGYNIYLGRGVFLNFNCVLLDVMPIRIGDGTQIGPAVQIYAADHPRGHEHRLAGLECGKSIMIGRNVWIGGGAILLPGITVGDDAIIGAGSVVTRDVTAGATVAGKSSTLAAPITFVQAACCQSP
jgi:maltose O-acetyltransferase